MRQVRLRNSDFTCGSVESIEEEADLDGSHEREVGRGRRDAQLAELRIILTSLGCLVAVQQHRQRGSVWGL